MKIKFLGTAAAEGWPGIFCTCDTCQKARTLKGKNYRSRFSIMIDDEYKIDFPPDSYYHMIREELDFTKLRHLFISHPHSDHLASYEFDFRRIWFTNMRGNMPLTVYGWQRTINEIKNACEENDMNLPTYHEVKPFEKIDANEFYVYPLPANHMRENDKPYIYLFERKEDKKTFLCAHDTGNFFDEVWEFLKGFKLDIVSIDCTHGKHNVSMNHLGCQNVVDVKKKLEELGIFNDGIFIANHFSHNGGLVHHEMEEFFKEYNILVAFDGMEINY